MPFTPWQSYSDSVEETLCDLGLLAEKGIGEERHIFRSEEFEIETRNCCLLEAIAGENGKRQNVRMEPAALKTRVKRYLQSEKESWFLILQFLLGLLHGQPNEAVEGYVECLKESLLSTPAQVNGKMTLLMMKCLFEYNSEDTVTYVAKQLQENGYFSNRINLQQCQVPSSDCKAIVYFLKLFKSLESVDQRHNAIGECARNELSKLIETGALRHLNLEYQYPLPTCNDTIWCLCI